jgi:hypothetical protein
MRVATVAPLLGLEFWEQISLSCFQVVFKAPDDQASPRNRVFVAVDASSTVKD